MPPLHTPSLTASDVVALLGLAPHPEGGFFRETFRDARCFGTATSAARAASTAIYFLLPAGVVSRWHRVDATEIWHWHAGAALELVVETSGCAREKLRLGTDLVAGERPQGVVPAHAWQQAASLGAWTLVGCTVAPGFEFSGFEILPDGVAPPAA